VFQAATAGDAKIIPLPKFTSVLTISPRRDFDHFEEDLACALVTCTIQVQDDTGAWADKAFLECFMNEYLSLLADIKQAITYAKYENYVSCSGHEDKPFLKSSIPPWLGPNPFAAPADADSQMTSSAELTPGKKPSHATGSKASLSSSAAAARADGVATVQPGLDLTPSATSRTRHQLIRSNSEDGASRESCKTVCRCISFFLLLINV
jgi:hypothetical protein